MFRRMSTMVTTRAQRIQNVLKSNLNSTIVNVYDDSHKHAHHEPMRGSTATETHLRIDVISDEFEGKSLIQRHRMVNSLLKEEFDKGLHALQINARTSAEWEKKAEK